MTAKKGPKTSPAEAPTPTPAPTTSAPKKRSRPKPKAKSKARPRANSGPAALTIPITLTRSNWKGNEGVLLWNRLVGQIRNFAMIDLEQAYFDGSPGAADMLLQTLRESQAAHRTLDEILHKTLLLDVRQTCTEELKMQQRRVNRLLGSLAKGVK